MPNQPKEGRHHHSLVFHDADWEVGKKIAEDVMGTSRNKVIEELWLWYLRRPGKKLPPRPPAEVVDQAYAAWHERNATEGTDEATSPLDVLRAAVREQGGEWTAKRAVEALATAFRGRPPTDQRARQLLNMLADEGLLVKHGKLGRLWTPAEGDR